MGFFGMLAVGVVVYLLWRILAVQSARAQIEAVSVAAASVERKFGTEEDARREGRLLEYYDAMASALGRTDEQMALYLGRRDNEKYRRALVVEVVTTGRQCRFLDEKDFEILRVEYPGPAPVPEPMCDVLCYGYCENNPPLPPGTTICPFCEGPAVADDEPDSFDLIDQARWQRANEAWEIWKRYRPREAARAEAVWRRTRESELAIEREELAAAVAAHRASQQS